MASQTEPVENKLVALASIAAELHSVMGVAWSVSLAGKNAKVISAQAGDKGRGFQPITESIDEISQQAIRGVDEISNEALRLSKIAVNEQRSIDAWRRFNLILTKNGNARHIKSLSGALKNVEDNMRASMREFKKSMNHLTVLLETMDQCMLSARAIASVSRIVTSSGQEYRGKLKVVADDLDKAASYIKQRLLNSYRHLNNVNMLTHKNI